MMCMWWLTCMNAVAMMIPDPKYFVMKKATGGTCIRFVLAAAMGSRAPVQHDKQLYPLISQHS